MRGTSLVSIRMSDDEKALFNEICNRSISKNNRMLFQQMLSSYLATASFALREKAEEVEKEIAYRTGKSTEYAAALTRASDENSANVELDMKMNDMALNLARYDAKTVADLRKTIGNLIKESDSTLDVIDLSLPQSIRRFVGSMMHAYRYNTDPRYKRNMDMNGMAPLEGEEE